MTVTAAGAAARAEDEARRNGAWAAAVTALDTVGRGGPRHPGRHVHSGDGTAAWPGLASGHRPDLGGCRAAGHKGSQGCLPRVWQPDPGTAASSGPQTWHGTIHGVNAPIAFGSIAIAAFIYGRAFARSQQKAWARYSRISGTATLLLLVAALTAALLDQRNIWHNAPGGLLERLSIITAWGWLSLLFLRTLRKLTADNQNPQDFRRDTPDGEPPPGRLIASE